jgi:hypothetical protein
MKRKFCYLAGLLALSASSLHAQSPSWVSVATSAAGLDTIRGFNVYVTDINNDHYPDFIALRGDWTVGIANALRTYINVPDPNASDPSARKFVDVTSTSGVNAMPGQGETSKGVLVVALADVNNDGNVDLVRGNYYHANPATAPDDRCEILLGDGQGHFTLVQNSGLHELGVINVTAFSFLDYDKDGNIDLFIARWFDNYGQNSNLWSPGILMKGNGDGTFTNVTAQAGITTPEPMYGCSVVDWNNDGWPDIATAPYCRTNGQLWKNNGNGTFTNVASSVGYNARYLPGDGGQAMCMWSNVPEDFDNDGDMDFFFSLVHGGNDANEGRSAIAVNGGAANNYALTIDRSLLTKKSPYSSHNGDYDASWLDIDNDGLIDLAALQGHYMPATDRLFIYHQGQNNKFTDISGDLGLIKAELKDLHSLEALDYDLDGDDDIIICRNGSPREMHLIKNEIGQDNNWTGVFLKAPQGVNKSAIGARIYVWSGGVKRMREVYAGRGNNGGQQPFALLFGLGNNTTIDSVVVAWPDAAGTTTTVKNPPINRYLEIGGSGLAVADVEKDAQEEVLRVYPNPARNFIIVQTASNATVKEVAVYDMTGRRMEQVKPQFGTGGGAVYCPIEQLPIGSYIVRVVTEGGATAHHTFTKQ